MAGIALKTKRLVAICGALLLSAATLAAQNHQRVLPLDDPAYGLLERLYLEAGLSLPFQVAPATEAEILHGLRRIDRSLLSPAGLRAYEQIQESVKPRVLFRDEGTFAFNASTALTLEGYAQADADVPWQYGHEERQPVFNLPIEFWLFESVYATFTATLKEEHRLLDDPANHWNLFSQANGFLEADWYFPFRAFFSVGGPNWYFQFGRDKLNFGNGTTGNLLLSDGADFHDFGLFTAYWDRFKFTTAYLYLDPWLTPEEQAIWDAGGYPNRVRDYHEAYKAVFLHRFDMKILKRVNLSITEALLWGTKYPQIRDFNPLMVFHNWFEYERSKGTFELGIEIDPWKYVNLHGGFFIWESQTAYEEEGGGGFPGAYAYLAGADSSIPVGPGYVDATFEWVKTDPWLYNRYHPLLKWTSRRRIWSYIPPDGFFYYDEPLGYELGPDAIRYAASLGYSVPGVGSASLSFDLVRQGETTTATPYMSGDYNNLETPTGVVEEQYVLRLGAVALPLAPLGLQARLPWLPEIKVGLDVSRVWVKNLGHTPGNDRTDWQVAASVSVGL